MILFLLKNRKLGLQLFLVLLLVIGTMPGGSEGIKCYVCEGTDADSGCKSGETDCPSGVCTKFVAGGKVTKKKCGAGNEDLKCDDVPLLGMGCACKGDLCNPAGRSTSNGKLIFAILMIPTVYYGFIRGGGALAAF